MSYSDVYGHVGFGEQHVHVAGHAAGDRVDRVLDLDAFLLELVGQLADRVLRLRDRHPVAGDDDHFVGVGEHRGDVVGADGAHVLLPWPPAPPAVGLHRAERAEQHVGDRAVHRFAHQHGEQRARRADQRAGDDQHVVAEHEAGRCRGQAGERVEQRDDDRHVGAADRQHEQDAQHERGDQRDPEELQRRSGRRRRPGPSTPGSPAR